MIADELSTRAHDFERLAEQLQGRVVHLETIRREQARSASAISTDQSE